MAKKKDISNEPLVSGLQLRNPDSKLNLKTARGTSVMWTLNEALQPQNFKQLSEKTQNGLLNGKTASQILNEIASK